jgi:4-hydroxy-2-oxoheptanedioate aldolase
MRPAWNHPVLLKRVLDIGAQTLLVPFVQNAGEARRAVEA